jgi:AraC-like DNA-binding protein
MLNTSTRASVATYFDEIEKELCEKNNEWIEAVSANVSLLLITIGRYVNSAIRNLPSLPAKEWHTVSRMVRTVTEQFGDSTLTLERISGELYISKSQLSRLFHKVAGESFSDICAVCEWPTLAVF